MTESAAGCLPPDVEARKQAIDISQSFIVQAPAGSGKTELLIQRILTLLATVNSPEEILAITFTRKAAGEMKERLLKALERAGDPTPPEELHERTTWERAVKAMQQDVEKGWQLCANPSRLQIMTIDSFCSSLSRRMPWLTRLGDQPGISDDPEKLYRQAAENFLSILATNKPGQEPVSRLLRHLDNRLDRLRDLLVDMLGRRDQWIRHVIGRKEDRRTILENALQAYIRSVLATVTQVVGETSFSEMCELGHYAAQQLEAENIESPLAVLLDGQQFDPHDPENLEKWLALCHLVLKSDGAVRQKVDKRLGFSALKTGEAPVFKERILHLLQQFEEQDFAGPLSELRRLPFARYNDAQWQILEALTLILPLAVVELRTVFRQTGTIDFIEVAGAALAGLGSTDDPGELLLKLDNALSHILVDEFQDTSFTQYELLRKLTSGWERGDGRTLFVVGDPMQSIYLFREADVGLFLKVCQGGLGGIDLIPITLTANFRSQQSLVAWFNGTFRQLFPLTDNSLTGAISYAEADPVRPQRAGPAVSHYLFCQRQDQEESEIVLRLIRQAEEEFPGGTCAVMVRSRAHLHEIIKLLNDQGVPYQAQDVDSLSSRPVISDLLALTRALLYPCDRIAWMAILRARWCGLVLADLLELAEHDRNVSVLARLQHLPQQQEMFSVLSPDGQLRLDRVVPILEAARKRRGRVAVARLIESTWLQLGGPACYDAQGLEDAAQFFRVLRNVAEGGDLLSIPELVRQLDSLHAAPDPDAGTGLQIMTVHKAKGLEFDTVILPGLGRGVRRRDKQLLQWLEQPDFELLLAPIPSVEGGDDTTYRSIVSILQQRENNETLRLLYVAATRAKERLFLLGHVKEADAGPIAASGSLLQAVWPVISGDRADLIMTEPEESLALKSPSIRRLLAGVEVPIPGPRTLSRDVAVVRASDSGQADVVRRVFTLNSQEGRIIGTVVHQWMERLARDGVERWRKVERQHLRARIKVQLSHLGVSRSRLEQCTDKSLICMDNIFASERAMWLVAERDKAESELSLSGLVNGHLMHATIDRTFVDDSVRWVVDYKTTSPEEGEELEIFLTRESDKYRSQLTSYMELIGAIDQANTVKGALYFPLIDAWKVVAG